MGRTLNMEEVGISCNEGGAFYNKIDAEKDQPQRMYMLSVEDPADGTNDLCRGSWNILKVRVCSWHACRACTMHTSHLWNKWRHIPAVVALLRGVRLQGIGQGTQCCFRAQ